MCGGSGTCEDTQEPEEVIRCPALSLSTFHDTGLSLLDFYVGVGMRLSCLHKCSYPSNHSSSHDKMTSKNPLRLSLRYFGFCFIIGLFSYGIV